MPTPWLVTSPPRQSKPSTAIARRSEKRCNHGLLLLRVMNKRQTKKECRCNESRSGNCCKKLIELLRSHQLETYCFAVAGADRDLLGLGTSFQVKRFHGVIAGWHVRNLERAILVCHRVIGMIDDPDVGKHPGSHVAFHANENFRSIESLFIDLALHSLGEVKFFIVLGRGMHVVHEGIRIPDLDRFTSHGTEDIGFIKAPFLVEEWLGGRLSALGSPFFEINENIP